MNPWTLTAAVWLIGATSIAITLGKAIRTADRQHAARQHYTTEAVAEARARIVGHYPTVTCDGRVPHHVAVRVIRSAQGERAGL